MGQRALLGLALALGACSGETTALEPNRPIGADEDEFEARDAESGAPTGSLADVEETTPGGGWPDDARDAGYRDVAWDGGRADSEAEDAARPPMPSDPCFGSQNEIGDGSFEERRLPIPAGQPRRAGDWGGDLARPARRVGSMSPRFGAFMLRADSTSDGPSGGAAVATQLYQVVEAPVVSSTPGSVRACAHFNRDDLREPSNDQMELFVWFFQGTVRTFPEAYADVQNRVRAEASGRLDGDPETWQQLCVQSEVPEGTDYVALEVRFVENVVNRDVDEFGRHAIDDVCLTFVD